MTISFIGDEYSVVVNWQNDTYSYREFNIIGKFKDNIITYQGEEIIDYVFNDNGEVKMSDYNVANILDKFELKDAKIYWISASDINLQSYNFEKNKEDKNGIY